MQRREFINGLSEGLLAMAGLSFFRCEKRTGEELPPNILFVIADDQSWPHAGAYGASFVETPSFDRVAREGVLFQNAFCAAPQCSPNRAALLTGRHIWQLEEAGTHRSCFPVKYQVYPDLLESAGYFTGYTGKGWSPGDWAVSGRSRNPAGPEYDVKRMPSKPHGGLSGTDYTGNFEAFLNARPEGKPFCFWFGGHEPHRPYEEGSGIRMGKKPETVEVPPFLPDTDLVRSDILDYAAEIEWFDRHLGGMLGLLETRGELDNTLVLVTGDNGMPFPRAKANLYEYGIHVPMAVMWRGRAKGGRTANDLISFTDIAPTFLEAAGLEPPREMSGKSFLGIIIGTVKKKKDESRTFILSGRERHSHARADNLGYPSRSIRTPEYLYIRNFKPDRWPAGDPVPSGESEGFHDIDDSPTKTWMLKTGPEDDLFRLAFMKRPEEELYDIKKDAGCMKNLAGQPEYNQVRDKLRGMLEKNLTEQGDPRMLGYGDIFDSYPRYASMRNLPGFREQGKVNTKYLAQKPVR